MKQYYNAPQFIMDELINKPFNRRKQQIKGKIDLEFRLQRFGQFFKGVQVIQQYDKGNDKFVWYCPYDESNQDHFLSDVYLVNTIKHHAFIYEVDLSKHQFFQFVIIPPSWEHYEAFTSEMLFRCVRREYPCD